MEINVFHRGRLLSHRTEEPLPISDKQKRDPSKEVVTPWHHLSVAADKDNVDDKEAWPTMALACRGQARPVLTTLRVTDANEL